MTNRLTRYRRVLGRILPRVAVWILSLAAAVFLLTGFGMIGALLAVITVVGVVFPYLSGRSNDRQPAARVLLVLASASDAGSQMWSMPLLIGVSFLLLGLMAEPTVGQATRPAVQVWGLSGLSLPLLARVREPLFLGVSVGILVLALACLGLPLGVAIPLTVASTILGLGAASWQLVRARTHATERAVRDALIDFAPAYGVYYSGSEAGAYQVQMWLPYLKRSGQRGVLVIRDTRFARAAASLGELPVILARSTESLEYVMVPSLGALFYVNNDAKNAQGVRFGGVSHVHLGHGDSDKPASYAASTAMFDRIFVAGQAGIDRFAEHGVLVPQAKFELVGRPQVEGIDVREPGSRMPEHPVVLYAPTWRGSIGDSLFGSLRHGERIVAALMDRGATVWFRPHPYSARDAESRVLIGKINALILAGPPGSRTSVETGAMTVFECMNASDALVTDVSSVASDYLYSNKPFAVTDLSGDLAEAYPIARAAVLLPLGEGDLNVAIAQLLGPDSRREQRARMRTYYLGDWPADQYVDVFVAAAARAMAPSPPASTGP